MPSAAANIWLSCLLDICPLLLPTPTTTNDAHQILKTTTLNKNKTLPHDHYHYTTPNYLSYTTTITFYYRNRAQRHYTYQPNTQCQPPLPIHSRNKICNDLLFKICPSNSHQSLSWEPNTKHCLIMINNDVPHNPNNNPNKIN